MITSNRKERTGIVVSNKMDKTIVVQSTILKKHSDYGKVVKHVRKFYAHDQDNQAQVGDKVRISETRPLSRLKRWTLKEIMEKASE